jgi:hypothetical protein
VVVTVGVGVGAGAELGAELGTGLGGAGLTGGDVVGVAVGAVVLGAGLAAIDDTAGRRATVTAAGSDRGVRPHLPGAAVPWCAATVAAAT